MSFEPSDRRVSSVSLLFVYGTLKPRTEGAAIREGWTADAVRGRLYDLGPYPGLVDLDDPSAGWVDGFVREVDEAELLQRLDPYEAVDEGLFARLSTTTRSRRHVWIYVFAQPLPSDARGPIESWSPAAGAGSPDIEGRPYSTQTPRS